MIKETFVLMSVAPIELLLWILVAMVTNQEVAVRHGCHDNEDSQLIWIKVGSRD